MTTQPTEPPKPPDAEWLKRRFKSDRYRRLIASDGNRKVRRVVAALSRAAKLASAWAAEHEGKCECDFCTLNEWSEDIWLDVVAAWKLAEGQAELIRSVTSPTPEQLAKQEARFVKREARKARQAQKAQKARRDADTPTIITTEGKQP